MKRLGRSQKNKHITRKINDDVYGDINVKET